MSLFQCESCGCCENTALSAYHWRKSKKEPLVCSGCEDKYDFDRPLRTWHGEFERVYLPKGMFVTNHEGNLANRQTGDTDFTKHRLPERQP